MENKVMKSEVIRGRLSLAIAAMVMGLIAGGVSAATIPATLSLSDNSEFSEELNRCVDLLRPQVQMIGAERTVYDVQDVKLTGPWYRFEISVSVENDTGDSLLNDYRVGCSANRWVDEAYLSGRRNSETLPKAILVVNSK
jgi:hypothetical protein